MIIIILTIVIANIIIRSNYNDLDTMLSNINNNDDSNHNSNSKNNND